MINLPSSEDLERAIIGQMILDPGCAKVIGERCDPIWFFNDKNRTVFKIFSAKIDANIYPDTALACVWLSEAGILADLGGNMYFADCMDKVGICRASDQYVIELRKLYYDRQIAAALVEVQKDISPENIEKLRIKREERDGCGADGIIHFKDCIPKVCELVEPLTKGMYDVLGHAKNEEYQNGMAPGDILTIGARPGVGKTVISTDIAVKFARKYKEPVLYFSTEMTYTETLQRMLAPLSGVEGWRFRKRYFDQEGKNIAAIGRAAEELAGLDIHLVDKPGPTLADVRAAMAAVKPRLVILDYLQVFNFEVDEAGKPEAIDRFLYGFKASLRSFDALGVITSQLAREVDGLTARQTPQLKDLKGSGGIEIASNSVILAWRHNKKDKETKIDEVPQIHNVRPVEFIHAKHRTGKTDVSVQMVFDEKFICFHEWNMETAERYNKDIIPTGKKERKKNANSNWGAGNADNEDIETE
jgi:replicative DNA helicase